MSLYERAAEAAEAAGKFFEQKCREIGDKEGYAPDFVDEVVHSLESYNIAEVTEQNASQFNSLQVNEGCNMI
jgi:hypothetical protein